MHGSKYSRILVVLALGAVVCAHARAQAISISEVQLTLSSDQTMQRVPGKLYRVRAKSSDRTWTADVLPTGRLSSRVHCNAGDQFEAEVNSAVAFPNDPVRLRCARVLAFSFTRPSFLIAQKAKPTFLDVASGEIDVKSLYALETQARRVGNAPLARATADSIVTLTADWLGDSRLEKFVERDATRNFELFLNAQGIEALKNRQSMLKIDPSGQLDLATQDAIGRRFGEKSAKKYASAFCAVKTQQVACTLDAPDPSSSASTVRVRYKIDDSRLIRQ